VSNQLLVVNRRLRAKGGKALKVTTASCTCCDDNTDPCASECGESYFDSFTRALDNCGNCIPGTIGVAISIGTPPTNGTCYGGVESARLIESGPQSGDTITACLPLSGTIDVGAGGRIGLYEIQGVAIPKLKWRSYDNTTCTGTFRLREVSRANIYVQASFLNPNPANIEVVAATCDHSFILFYHRFTVASGVITNYEFTDFCAGLSVPGMTASEWSAALLALGQSTGFTPLYTGGTAAIKPCCATSDTKPCDDAPATRWYQARRCSDNVLVEIWFAQGQVTADSTTAYMILPSQGSCLYFRESDGHDYPAGQTPPIGQITPYAIVGVFASCELCLGANWEVRDCDGDAVVGYVDPDDVDTSLIYELGGLCVYFQALTGEADPDLPTFAAADFGGSEADCDSCIAPDCDGTPGTGCVDSDLVVNVSYPGGCTAGATSIPTGSNHNGTWGGSADPTTSTGIVCSGKYWVLTLVVGSSCTYSFHSLRTSDCPGTGSEPWEFVSASGTDCCTDPPPTVTVELA
jgi:hypothetical protein